MFFQANNTTFAVKFHRIGTTTIADLFQVRDEILVSTEIQGKAVLYYKDTFEKSKGRKVALADLIYQISVPDAEGVVPEGLTKEDKAMIWEQYFKTHNK